MGLRCTEKLEVTEHISSDILLSYCSTPLVVLHVHFSFGACTQSRGYLVH